MTEPENFDDDLFADLSVPPQSRGRHPLLLTWPPSYNDDEPSTAKHLAPQMTSAPALAAAEPMPVDRYDETPDIADQNGADTRDDYDDDDDDDVDFNLGNGSTTHRAETPMYRAPSPVPLPVATKGPNAKEDG